LRASVAQRSHELFFDATPLLAPGGGTDGPIAAECKKANWKNSTFQKVQNRKTKIVKTFVANLFCFPRDRIPVL
jgi:hypothetical protein